MYIDLTQNGGATTEDVKRLLSSKDDSAHRQLRVTLSGQAYLSDSVGADNIGGLKFRFETWLQGNGYTGVQAAADPKWVEQVKRHLNENWPNPKSEYIDY